MEPLTSQRLREVLHYNPETGLFTWRVNIYSGHHGKRLLRAVGDVAGGDAGNGYWRVSLDGKRYLAHRLAWLYMTGDWPNAQIDHRDRNPANNAWPNLREATNAQNGANKGALANNKIGIKGVFPTANGRFRAHIRVNGNRRYLGTFATAEVAHAVYRRAAKAAFGEFAGSN